jgi:hypothetical protein
MTVHFKTEFITPNIFFGFHMSLKSSSVIFYEIGYFLLIAINCLIVFFIPKILNLKKKN